MLELCKNNDYFIIIDANQIKKEFECSNFLSYLFLLALFIKTNKIIILSVSWTKKVVGLTLSRGQFENCPNQL